MSLALSVSMRAATSCGMSGSDMFSLFAELAAGLPRSFLGVGLADFWHSLQVFRIVFGGMQTKPATTRSHNRVYLHEPGNSSRLLSSSSNCLPEAALMISFIGPVPSGKSWGAGCSCKIRQRSTAFTITACACSCMLFPLEMMPCSFSPTTHA